MPEISFKEMLIVPDGPPESVWERALDAAFAAPPEDTGADEGSPTSELSDTEDAEFLPDDNDDSDSHPTMDDDDSDSGPTMDDDGSAAPAWDAGQDPDGGDDVQGGLLG